MRKKKILVKVSGDEFLKESFLSWVAKISKNSWLVICVGGGTEINMELKKIGIRFKKHGPMGRETKTKAEEQIQIGVLKKNQKTLQDLLFERKIFALVEIPFISIGAVLCPVNGDEIVRAAYLGYDKIYVVTSPDRVLLKAKNFSKLKKKVKIKSFKK